MSDMDASPDLDAITGGAADPVLDDQLGVADGVATLDGTGNVPLAQLGNVPPSTPDSPVGHPAGNIQWWVPGFSARADSTEFVSGDQGRFCHWYNDRPRRITAIKFHTTTVAAGGTEVRVGVTRADPADWQPLANGVRGEVLVPHAAPGDGVASGLAWDLEVGFYLTVHVPDDNMTFSTGLGASAVGSGWDPSLGASSIDEHFALNALTTAAFGATLPDWGFSAVDDHGVLHMVSFQTEAQP